MLKKNKSTKLPLKNAAKRAKVVLGSIVITIKQKPDGTLEYQVDNASEAAELSRQLNEQAATGVGPWNGIRFSSFIESLGDTQKAVLRILINEKEKRVPDEVLRKALNLESNQQLAGILSGISKQAAARDIPARAVFRIDNDYTSGQAAKFYLAAPEFLKIASDNNWPDSEEDSLEEEDLWKV